MSGIKIIVIFSMLLLCIFIYIQQGDRGSYPVNEDVDQFFKKYKNISDDCFRKESLQNFLGKMANPQNNNEDYVLEYFLNKLSNVYLTTEDDCILDVIDAVEVDAGFANYICGFYDSIKESPLFKVRYEENNKPLQRCVGISFDQDEIDMLEPQVGMHSCQ